MKWCNCLVDSFIRRIRDSDRKKIPIGGDQNPTVWRWFVIPRNRFLNIYLHNFLKDDEEDLHDHRMFNISFVLQGNYIEEYFVAKPRPGMPLPRIGLREVRRFIPRFRLPSTPHRVTLYESETSPNGLAPVWSLFIGFPHVRDWGFYTNDEHGSLS